MKTTETTTEIEATIDAGTATETQEEERTRIVNEQIAPRRLRKRRGDAITPPGDLFSDPSEDPFLTHGKNGIPPLVAQPDPQPPQGAKRGRPRGTSTARKQNYDLTAIVYGTKDQSDGHGRIVRRYRDRIVVDCGQSTGFHFTATLPTAEEGETWVYRYVFDEHAARGARIVLSPATFLPPGDDAAKRRRRPKTKQTTPASASDLADLFWDMLEMHLSDLRTAIANRNLEVCKMAVAHASRLLAWVPPEES